MLWIYRLQNRVALTAIESKVLLVIIAIFLTGMAGSYVEKSQASFPPAVYAAAYTSADSILASKVQLASITIAVADTEKVSTSATRTTSTTPLETTLTSSEPTVVTPPPVRMNLNWASASQLQRIKGIGPSLAGRIIAYRNDNGPFASVEDAINVSGIGQKKLEKMLPMLFVETQTESTEVASN